MRLDQQWALLGIAPTDDRKEVKRAYVRVLKTIDVDADPAAFVRLREAMEAALEWGTARPWWEEPEPAAVDPGADGAEAEGEGEAAAPDDIDTRELDEEIEDWEQWRPALPAFGSGRLADRIAELDALLYAADEPDPARVRALAEELLADPELAHVDRASGIERWMAEAIASAFPKSDPLIPLAVERFGWDRSGAGWRRDWNVERVLQRREDLGFLAACGRFGHPHHRALAELRGPPRRRLGPTELPLAGEVADLLELVDRHRQTLVEDLNRESVDWWRAYLAGPHLPPLFWLWMAAGTAVPAFIIAVALAAREARGPPLWLLFLSCAAASFAILFGWSRLAAANRKRAEEGWRRESRTGAERPVAAALMLPPAAALLPAGAASVVAASLPAVWLAMAAFRRSWVPPEWTGESNRPRVFLPAIAAAASLSGLLTLPLASALTLAPPLALACWLGSQCYHPLRVWLATLARGRRLGLLAAALALAAGSLAVLTLGTWPMPAWALALAPVAIVAAHLAAAAALVDIHAYEWPLRLAVILFYFLGPVSWPDGFAGSAFVALALYGLVYASVRLVLAIRDELRGADPLS